MRNGETDLLRRFQIDHQLELRRLIDRQIAAFLANDPAGAVSVYTDDVVHRMIGPNAVGGVGLRDPKLPMVARGKSAAGRAPYYCTNEQVPEVLRPEMNSSFPTGCTWT